MINASPRTPAQVGEVDDAELVRRSIAAPDQFDALYSRHVHAIFMFAAARVGPDHAEDVTAETFTAAFRSLSSFDQAASSARPWLYGIAANKLRRHREHERKWLDRIQKDPLSVESDEIQLTADRVDAGRLVPRLAAALATLSPGERDVLLMHVLDDLTHEQIAQALNVRRGTAKARLSRGRARLRTELGPLNDDPRSGEPHA